MWALLWDVINPLFWLSAFWIILVVESILLRFDMNAKSYVPRYANMIMCGYTILSVFVAWTMITRLYASEALGWDLQFGFMPIPPGGGDRVPGFSYIGEYIFMILYPAANAFLAYFGYRILVVNSKYHSLTRTIISGISIVALTIGKFVFETKVLIGYYE